MKNRPKFCLFLILMSLAFGEYPDFVPKVHHIKDKGFTLKIDRNWAIIADLIDEHEAFNAEQLRTILEQEFQLDLEIKETCDPGQNTRRIIMGKPLENSFVDSIAKEKAISLSPGMDNEAYVLDVSQEDITILACGSAGVFYGTKNPGSAYSTRRRFSESPRSSYPRLA